MTITRLPGRRHDTMAYGDQLRFERRQWLDPQYVAWQLETALKNPVLAGDPYAVIGRAEAAVEFQRLHPKAARRLGEAVIAAAVPETSACRWCAGTMYARVHRVPPPDPANRGAQWILGEPCQHPRRMGPAERKQLMRTLEARTALSRLAVKRRLQAAVVERQRQLVASGAKPGFVVGDPASWRKWARQDLANRAPWVLGRKGRYATHSYQCLCAGCRRAW